jgi:glyoxylase-like metal-dependent hydrolase (beta-lactamase superfamily II)
MQQSGKYQNDFQVVDEANLSSKNCQLISIHTTPQVAIGQRACLCLSPKGNILWDCITYLDDDTVATIKGYGGVSAIVISHPHYYSTCLHWARALNCKVYLSVEDEEWVMRKPASSPSEEGEMELWAGQRMSLGQDGEFLCVKTGGHFPGSSVLSWPRVGKLLVADTVQVVPSGIYHVDRPKGTVSFTFMWSYPNFVREKCCHLLFPPIVVDGRHDVLIFGA